MYMLGDKIASTIVAQSADVPTIKWNGTGVTLGDLVQPGEVCAVSR
jgi:biotin carboxylase